MLKFGAQTPFCRIVSVAGCVMLKPLLVKGDVEKPYVEGEARIVMRLDHGRKDILWGAYITIHMSLIPIQRSRRLAINNLKRSLTESNIRISTPV